MLGVGQDISFSFSVSYQILPHDLVLAKDLHCIELASLLLLHKVDLTKAATAQHLDWDEMLRTHLLIISGVAVCVAATST